ncbi:acetamidase/formamidase family protein [Kordiimonas aquimaris]|uniref:acetamidase/formamidase family protein n=1 Tax=Kordiimonas aquimaris TaxID=707591 RepID=UPI0021D02A41|nr:acetamidase/formamidase family protein [Kordiimonas aquimaris]
MHLNKRYASSLTATLGILFISSTITAQDVVEVGGQGDSCLEDPQCINRIHPDIPMTARAKPGQTILFHTRDAADFLGTVDSQTDVMKEQGDRGFGRVHPMTGPVYIEGSKAGDVVAFTIHKIKPGKHAYTRTGGFAADLMGPGSLTASWRLTSDYAVTDDIPGIKIPNASFPGVVTTMPDRAKLAQMRNREQALAEAGGAVRLPSADDASPAAICGPDGNRRDECLRTIPPREHGGNMDIRYLKTGVTIYLPCYIDGCALAIGDLHYAQGDGEVSGTAIEMSADVWGVAEIIKDGPDLSHGPHYSGASTLLDIPSTKFYAVTGFPVKKAGSVPPRMEYLQSAKVADLENLSNDINLAARNALDGIVDYIIATYGYDRPQAYIIASVAVDLRIGQLVDVPNVGVTAILPLDIFESE